DVVDLLERLVVVAAVALERDGEVFVGVNVMQRDRPRVAIGDRVLKTLTAQQQRQRGEGNRLPRSRRAVGQHLARGTNRHLRSRITIHTQDGARRSPAARMTNRVLLGSVNARLAPPSPSVSPNTREVWQKLAAARNRPGAWVSMGGETR